MAGREVVLVAVVVVVGRGFILCSVSLAACRLTRERRRDIRVEVRTEYLSSREVRSL